MTRIRAVIASAVVAGVLVFTPTTAEATPEGCHDFFPLHAGEAHPVRQHWFNHLDARGYARYWIACVHQWDGTQWDCLDRLWEHESEWKHTAQNPRSTAFGIPQALASTRQRYLGAEWQTTNPRRQIQAGTDYISDRYKRPTGTGCRGPY